MVSVLLHSWDKLLTVILSLGCSGQAVFGNSKAELNTSCHMCTYKEFFDDLNKEKKYKVDKFKLLTFNHGHQSRFLNYKLLCQ